MSAGPAWQALENAVEAAGPRLSARTEWKEASRLLRAPPDDPDDRERAAGAATDLLALAAAEVAEAEVREAAERRRREQEDRALLAELEGAGKVAVGLSAAAFVFAPLTMGPFGPWCAWAATPALFAVSRLLRARARFPGRLWIVPRAEVDEAEQRWRLALVLAGASGVMAGVWAVVALLRNAAGA